MITKDCMKNNLGFADALEETEEKIARIVEIAQKYAPEYDEREILREVMQGNEMPPSCLHIWTSIWIG